MQYCFGRFRFCFTTGELRRNGARVLLQLVLEKLVIELAALSGLTISRHDLAARMWPDGMHLDYENSLNNATARAGLAHANVMMGDQIIDATATRDSLEKARRAVERAMKIAPDQRPRTGRVACELGLGLRRALHLPIPAQPIWRIRRVLP